MSNEAVQSHIYENVIRGGVNMIKISCRIPVYLTGNSDVGHSSVSQCIRHQVIALSPIRISSHVVSS